MSRRSFTLWARFDEGPGIRIASGGHAAMSDRAKDYRRGHWSGAVVLGEGLPYVDPADIATIDRRPSWAQ